jgi:hypothetical protein
MATKPEGLIKSAKVTCPIFLGFTRYFDGHGTVISDMKILSPWGNDHFGHQRVPVMGDQTPLVIPTKMTISGIKGLAIVSLYFKETIPFDHKIQLVTSYLNGTLGKHFVYRR